MQPVALPYRLMVTAPGHDGLDQAHDALHRGGTSILVGLY